MSTLSEWIKKTVCEPGIQYNVLTFLNQRLESMSARDKATAISIDEMSIRKDIVYSRLHDTVYGPHGKLVVVMARGLFSKWKQPIFFDFDHLVTNQLFQEIVSLLFSVGLRVHACVTDMGPENRRLWKELGVSPDRPFIMHPCDNDSNIFFLADAPHMLKLIRNHIIDHGLKTPSGVLDKSLFEKLFAADIKELKLCPKVRRSSHVDIPRQSQSRQRVRPAAELLSTRVSKAIDFLFPEDAAMASVIRVVDSYFDVFNSRIPYADKPLRCGYGLKLSQQNVALDKMEQLISATRVGNHRALIPFQKGILMSIKSLRSLFPELAARYDVSYLLTHRINQDCLESFFSQVRGASGYLRHPSPLDVIHNIRKLVASGTCGEIRSANTSLEDTEVLTAEVLAETTDGAIKVSDNSAEKEIDVDMGDLLEKHEKAEKGGLEYVAGFVAHKLKLTHPELGISDEGSGWISYIDRGGLTTPSERWMKQCQYLEHHFLKHNGSGIRRTNSLKSLIDSFTPHNQETVPEEAVSLYLRTRFFIRLKPLNESVKLEAQEVRAKRKLKDHSQ